MELSASYGCQAESGAGVRHTEGGALEWSPDASSPSCQVVPERVELERRHRTITCVRRCIQDRVKRVCVCVCVCVCVLGIWHPQPAQRARPASGQVCVCVYV